MNLTPQEQASLQFYAWEIRGRGWRSAPYPIQLEPPYIPFPGHTRLIDNRSDDTFRHGLRSWLTRDRSLDGGTVDSPPALPDPPLKKDLQQEPLVYLQLHVASGQVFPVADMEAFIISLSRLQHLASFEIIGTSQRITFQIVVRKPDSYYVQAQVQAFFPEIIIQQQQGILYQALDMIGEAQYGWAELGLAEEFMRPLATPARLSPDPLTAFVGLLDTLEGQEVAMMQVLFQGVRHPWAEQVLRSLTTDRGEPFLAESPEMMQLAKEKLASPLWAVNIRVMAVSNHRPAMTLCGHLGNAIIFNTERVGSNTLLHLTEDGPEVEDFVFGVIDRVTRRTGMLLNAKELLNYVHVSGAFPSDKLSTMAASHEAPKRVQGQVFSLGTNHHVGKEVKVGLPMPDRLRHVHIVGATGTGKSTLLTNLIVQNIYESAGGLVLDPHGDLIDDVIAQIPESDHHRLVVVDPSNQDSAIGFNLLAATSEQEKILLASDLTSVFRSQATSWGDQMDTVLQNAIGAFLDHPQGGTLLELRQFLIDPGFRKRFLKQVSDPLTVSYWEYEFPKLRGGAITSLLTRLQLFLRPKPVRYMLCQRVGVNFRYLMDEGQMILVKLSQGLIGESNSYLLGGLILSKIYQAALSRQQLRKEARRPFFVYLDEFQNFITPTLEGILSGARKYGLGLTLAHQNLDQLFQRNTQVAQSILANAGTQLIFRVKGKDASALAQGLSHFDSDDLEGLSIGHCIARFGTKGEECNLSIPLPDKVGDGVGANRIANANYQSQLIYGVGIEDLKDSIDKVFTRSTPQPKVKEQSPTPPEPIVETPKPKDTPSPVTVEPPAPAPPLEPPLPPNKDFDQKAKDYLEQQTKQKARKEHRNLQVAIKRLGEGLNYKAELEAPTPNGKGRVDVLLTKEKESIACEVAISTTNEHEMGNVRKCLEAKYTTVFLICPKPKRLKNLQVLAKQTFSTKQLQRIHITTKDGLADYLSQKIIVESSKEQVIKGYRVKTNYIPVSEQTAGALERRLTELLMNHRTKRSTSKK